ncbi:putative RNA-directed DNA polymerase from transposon BS [Araneus ventricosus]|uniref:Putative RNA-directed DNA polymerase from transposon BS n=1 Tax=Araneus ventricosus TaxID=182803 RepID=A0A4Y2UCE0_ARAVE|nr:putative RNA-directed DNA polymerase from transposon BS [Araneus ventricosus]
MVNFMALAPKNPIQPTNRTFHSVDLAICSPFLLPFLSLTVDNDLYNSDHFPLIITDNRRNPANSYRPPKYILNAANWQKFTSLANINSDTIKSSSIEQALSYIVNTIIEAADSSIPKTSGKRKKQNKPWWNAECQQAYKIQRKAWGIFRRYPTTQNFISFKKSRAESRKIQRRIRRASWRKFISGITSTISSRQMWTKVKKASGVSNSNAISVLIHNGQTISSLKGIADSIASTLAYTCSSQNYPRQILNNKINAEKQKLNFNSRTNFSYNGSFSFLEFQSCLASVHDSSPGPDNITYSMIKHLTTESQNALLHFYNRIWQEQYFPTLWQQAIIIPLLKPGKDPKNPSNYRPIALTCCLCKLLERMINRRLVHYLEANKYLHPFQSGFRKGRSTIDNLLALETDIRLSFLQRKHLVAIFFDIEKAYDRTWRYGILKDLYDLGLRGNLPIFIKNFLQVRKFRVKVESEFSDFFIQEEGVPQAWGADRDSMLKIYRATVLSKLEYGCTIYGSARKSVLQKLDPVHHTALRLCSGAFRTSPVKSLYVECYEPALELKRQMLSLNYYFKIQSNSNHPFHDFKLRPFLLRLQNARKSLIPVFFTRVHDILSDFNLFYLHVTPHPKTNFPPWGIPVVQFLNPFKTFIKSDTADIVYQQIFIEHRQEYNDFIAIYTDGSKSADLVSFAVVFPNTTLSFKLHSSCSVFTAEIAAVLLALEQISDFLERKFIIYTDSQSVLESLKSFYIHSHHHPLVLNVLRLLNKLASRDFNILLCWVPSHVGIIGNEEADKAAKLASTQTNSTVPLTDFKKYTKALFYSKWQRQWDTETENKLRAVKPHVQPWPSLMNRKADTLLTRLRVGHTRYTHRHLLLGEQAPMCSQCNCSMSVQHILSECPNFNSQRLHFFRVNSVDLSLLLGKAPHVNLFAFLRSIGFYPHI